MKAYYNRPKKDVRIVKLDAATDEYEFWMLVPVFIGTARKLGTQRILTDDQQQFTNLSSAARYLLDKMGEPELAGEQKLYIKKETAKAKVGGTDLLAKGIWLEFCKLRNLDVRNLEALEKVYYITKAEAEDLGLEDFSSL